MIQIQNGLYKSIAIDWANITLPLNAGTPVSLAGAVANNEDAVGIVPQTYKEVPLMPEIYVLIGGDVYRKEVEDTFGDELEDAAISAMDGIRFYDEDGTPADGGGGGSEGGGGAFNIGITVDSETDALVMDKTAGEILAAVEDGQFVFGVFADESFGFPVTLFYYLAGVSRLPIDETAETITFDMYGLPETELSFVAASEEDYPASTANYDGGDS